MCNPSVLSAALPILVLLAAIGVALTIREAFAAQREGRNVITGKWNTAP